MGPFNPILAIWQSECVLFNPGITLTSKEKLLVIMVRPLEITSNLNPISHGAILPYFSRLAIWMCTFQFWYDLDLKSKVFSLNSKTLEITSDLNPISHRPFNPVDF